MTTGSNGTLLTSGSVGLGDSNDLFVKLAYTVPFAASSANVYITSKLSLQFIQDFNPSYFQIPYIYSAADNLINGNYTSSSKSEDNIIITNYEIPYTSKFKKELVTIVTYFNKDTNILFYEIPRVFSYNSKDQASVAVTQDSNDFIGKVKIPASFITSKSNKKNYTLLLNIKLNDIILNEDATPAALVSILTAIVSIFRPDICPEPQNSAFFCTDLVQKCVQELSVPSGYNGNIYDYCNNETVLYPLCEGSGLSLDSEISAYECREIFGR